MVARRLTAWLAQGALRQRVIEALRAAPERVYLVGGTVRDILLGRDSLDIDLAVDGPAMGLARRLADGLRAAYVPLDPERDVARVVLREAAGPGLHLDLAGLRASDILSDLRARDFAVNAMAVPVLAPGRAGEGGWGALLDPTGGRSDLVARLLRAASPRAFVDDPLRVLRAVRLRGSLGFCLEGETEGLARAAVGGLERVSPERIRDELVLILALPGSAALLTHLRALDAAGWVLPEVFGADGQGGEDALGVLAAMERLYGALLCAGAVADEGPPTDAVAAPHAAGLQAHWREELSSGRPRCTATKLAALLLGVAGPADVAARLRFSAREARLVAATVAAAHDVGRSAEKGGADAVAVYRLFHRHGDAVLDGALLALAAAVAAGGHTPLRLETTVAFVLDAWFSRRGELIDPPPLVRGEDVAGALHAAGVAGPQAGPRVGRILERIREAQVAGQVHDRSEALALARALARQED